ncbi:MAG: TonB-dependent receptor plug domain-containing protein [Flavobacteriaceae bacterium]|nr:TonB-dependent receptor plug domain-containing protein [Flavobacteriaceae bacterium]
MNYSKSLLSALFLVLFTTAAFAQSVITGTVVDGANLPIAGAEITVVGTANSTNTDTDGAFSIESPAGSGLLEITDLLNGTQQISYTVADGQTLDLGNITLSGDGVSLASMIVIGRGVIDLTEDRNTPIATSVISGAEIQDRAVGNVEFPEAMKNTPNVYVANQAGGFGDGQMFLRGFDQSNTAFLLNGQPINGMEDGNMYWSNWQGMADIANGIQVQRGLGSSKLAISSVGGTVNIVTKATEKKQGGFARFMTGNDSYFKGTLGYNTGLMESGWGVSIMVDHWQGWRKWAEGTKGQGQNYFLSVGKQAGLHNFNFMVFGAPQWHDQNFSKRMDLYERRGTKYNNNYGFLDGEMLSWRRNYYHKPVMNLNWDWDISTNSNLSTVLYASFGRGGGTGNYGSSSRSSNILNDQGLADFTTVFNNNSMIDGGIGHFGNAGAIRSSVNNHQWYGAVTNFEHTMDAITLNVGADVRFYKGDHFRQLNNLLGLQGWNDASAGWGDHMLTNGQYIVTETFEANPWASLFNYADEGQRIAYDNSEWINYQGAFGQIEYAVDAFSAFFQGAVSNQSYKKEDRFLTAGTQSDQINRIGYNVKGGAAYNFLDNHTLFVNAGYYSRQPFLDNIYEYGTIEQRVPEVENEEITGLEAGYRIMFGKTTVNLNAYWTKWANRFLGASGNWQGEEVGFRFLNIAQLHKGLEMDFNSKVSHDWRLRGYLSYNDFKYDGVTPINIIDSQTAQVNETVQGDLTGTFVGEAPMVNAGFGAIWDVTKNFSLNADINVYGKLYGFVDVEDVALNSLNNLVHGTNNIYQAERLKDYTTTDAGFTYKFNFLDQGLKLRGNVYNLFNTSYISRKDNFGYFFGNGRTWNASITYEF